MLENWYDGQSRRIAKSELVNGQTLKTIYPAKRDWHIIAVMNASGRLMKSYTRGVGLAGDIGTLGAITFHPGSWRNEAYYMHCNPDKSRASHRGDIVVGRQGTTTVTTYDYSVRQWRDTQRLASGDELGGCEFRSPALRGKLDRSTVLYYYGYRFYAPAWQRWISRDPVGESSGDNNLFAFVGNGPTTRLDQFGLFIYIQMPPKWDFDPCYRSGGHYEPYWLAKGYKSPIACMDCEAKFTRETITAGIGGAVGGCIGLVCGGVGGVLIGVWGRIRGFIGSCCDLFC